MKWLAAFVSGWILLLNAACAPDVESPTADTAPTGTPSPAMSPTVAVPPDSTPEPTDTPVPTATSTAEPAVIPTAQLEYGESITIEHGGFSFVDVPVYVHTFRPGSVALSSDDQIVLLSMSGGDLEEELSIGEAMGSFLTSMAQDLDDFSASPTFVVEIGGEQGLATNVSGELFGNVVVGEVAFGFHDEEAYFAMAALAPKNRWDSEGRLLFEGLINSVEFFSPAAMIERCPISLDPGYGYSAEQAIGVGQGNALEGPLLERGYLDILLGPGGESIEYTRTGSVTFEGTILDIYDLTIGGTSQVISLYLDMYHIDPFVIPQGFICAWSTP